MVGLFDPYVVDRSVADVQFDARMNAAISFCIRKAR